MPDPGDATEYDAGVSAQTLMPTPLPTPPTAVFAYNDRRWLPNGNCGSAL